MERREKLKESFRQSKAKVKEWELSFFAQHQRKPTKEEMKNAPDKIQICYKNCWKIKSYFETHKSENNDSMALDETSQTVELPASASTSDKKDFSGIFDKTTSQVSQDTSCKDISNLSRTGTWGDHLNKKPVTKITSGSLGSSSFTDMSIKLGLDMSQISTVKTRKSLKKRNKTFQSFTDTMGPVEESSSSLTASTAPTPISSESLLQSEVSNEVSQDQIINSSHKTVCDNIPTVVEEPKMETSLLPPDNNDNDEDDMILFPSLKVKHQDVDKKMPTVKTSNQSLRRKVDSDWLARCTGMEIVPEPDVAEKDKDTKPSVSPKDANLEASSISTRTISVEVPPTSRENVKEVVTEVGSYVPTIVETNDPFPINDKLIKTSKSSEICESMKVKTVPKKKRKIDEDEDSDYENEKNKSEDDFPKVKPKTRQPRRKKAKIDLAASEDVPTEDVPAGPSQMNMFALGFEEKGVDTVMTKKTTTAKERLEKKVLSGKANENFVKIDLKKKSFSKGKMTGARIKRAEFKRKLDMKEGRKVKEYKCYNCGEAGHFAW